MEGATKSFPANYPSDALDILRAMSFTGGENISILGSMSIRSQQYAGDYDAHEVVNRKGKKAEVLHKLALEFKEIVKRLRRMPNVSVGDIKAGSIPEWEVFDEAYSAPKSLSRIDNLLRNGVISEPEAERARSILKPRLSVVELLKVKKELRFNIVRWNVPEVLYGSKKLRDGRTYTLEEAFSSPSVCKLDVIGFVQNNKFTEFSVIYNFKLNGKSMNYFTEDIAKSLEKDILFYRAEGKPFKALKRRFALAKLKKDNKTMAKLTPILNSDLGRLYSLSADIETLINLLETDSKVNMKDVKFEIDQFRARMANVYAFPSFIKKEHKLVGQIRATIKSSSKIQIIAHLQAIQTSIDDELNKNTPTLRGGLNINLIPSVDAVDPMNPDVKMSEGKAYEQKLRDAAHMLTNKDPAASYGLRAIADELFDELQRLRPFKMQSPEQLAKERKSKDQHEFFRNIMLHKVIRGDVIREGREMGRIIPSFDQYYDQVVAPTFMDAETAPELEGERQRVAQKLHSKTTPRILIGRVLQDNPSFVGRDPYAMSAPPPPPPPPPPADTLPKLPKGTIDKIEKIQTRDEANKMIVKTQETIRGLDEQVEQMSLYNNSIPDDSPEKSDILRRLNQLVNARKARMEDLKAIVKMLAAKFAR